MPETTRTDYEILRCLGHTAAKAQEIILDAKRGDDFCIKWLEWARKQVESTK